MIESLSDHAPLNVVPYIIFFKIKNCLKDDLFISCDYRIGKMLHNICISAVAMVSDPWPMGLLLMLVAKYYNNMNRSAHKHLNFLEYKINVHSLFLSYRETALKNNKLQEFLQAWMPVKELLDNII